MAFLSSTIINRYSFRWVSSMLCYGVLCWSWEAYSQAINFQEVTANLRQYRHAASHPFLWMLWNLRTVNRSRAEARRVCVVVKPLVSSRFHSSCQVGGGNNWQLDPGFQDILSSGNGRVFANEVCYSSIVFNKCKPFYLIRFFKELLLWPCCKMANCSMGVEGLGYWDTYYCYHRWTTWDVLSGSSGSNWRGVADRR